MADIDIDNDTKDETNYSIRIKCKHQAPDSSCSLRHALCISRPVHLAKVRSLLWRPVGTAKPKETFVKGEGEVERRTWHELEIDSVAMKATADSPN